MVQIKDFTKQKAYRFTLHYALCSEAIQFETLDSMIEHIASNDVGDFRDAIYHDGKGCLCFYGQSDLIDFVDEYNKESISEQQYIKDVSSPGLAGRV